MVMAQLKCCRSTYLAAMVGFLRARRSAFGMRPELHARSHIRFATWFDLQRLVRVTNAVRARPQATRVIRRPRAHLNFLSPEHSFARGATASGCDQQLLLPVNCHP